MFVYICMSVCVFVLYVCVGLRVYLHLSVCLCASVATHTSVQVPVSVGGGGLSWYPGKGPLLLGFWLVSGSSGESWVWEPGRKVD